MRDATTSTTGETVKVIIKFKAERSSDDYENRDIIALYNLIFNNVFNALKFSQHNRRYYDAHRSKALTVQRRKLEVWPGYVSAVDHYEGGLLVQLDVTHRVLRMEPVIDFIMSAMKGGGDAKGRVEKGLIGSTVVTRYNNNSYIIDDIDFTAKPTSTFKNSKGEELTYLEYYRTRYNLDIVDKNQPMLIHRPRKRSEGDIEKLIYLVPELCIMSGLTDELRKDFKVMKEIASVTRITPAQRHQRLRSYLEAVREVLRLPARNFDHWCERFCDTIYLSESGGQRRLHELGPPAGD